MDTTPELQHGRARYGRSIDWLGTYACRFAAPWFRDILWRVTPAAAERFQLPIPAERTVYLTFDDGPTDRGTPVLLEVLARFKVPATFFVVGDNCQKFPARTREILQAGHVLGNHTRTHLDPWRTLFPTLAEELIWTQGVVEDLTGQRLHWVRPPHGHVTNKLRTWCEMQQRPIAMWDVLPADFAPWASPGSVKRFVVRHARAGSIIVLHDNDLTVSRTPLALEWILRDLQAMGWKFAAFPASIRLPVGRAVA